MAKNSIFVALLAFCCWFPARADHITGGEMYYRFIISANNVNHYQVTLKLFMRCNSGRQFANPTYVSVFDRSSFARVTDLSIPLSRTEHLELNDAGPCVTNPPPVCYEVGYYEFTVDLPSNAGGYILASQVNFRIAGISNLQSNYGLIGALYSTEIPGTSVGASAVANNSAHFTGSDLVVVCASNAFNYSFAANDGDGDELRYYFCDAYQSSGSFGGGGNNSTPPDPPPFPKVPYNTPYYAGYGPLGGQVQINSSTGEISGIAPPEGIYVVTVCVDEIRNGKVIATQRKDLQINVADCSIASASLLQDYMLCDSSFRLAISNLSNSPLIQTQQWEISSSDGRLLYAGNSPQLNYLFADTGLYQVKLVINKGQTCSDSSTAPVRVYPGLKPDFLVDGTCVLNDIAFSDQTRSRYGTINSWFWDFGDHSAPVFGTPSPKHNFSLAGTQNIRMIVSDSKGCSDTLDRPIELIEKPKITLAFRDTLICIPDSVELKASGQGQFSWSPSGSNPHAQSGDITVQPLRTTVYHITLNQDACVNTDSVLVRVVDHVSLSTMPDTTVCRGDTIPLLINSDGLQFTWTPGGQVLQPGTANTLARVDGDTRFTIQATIGSCLAEKAIFVKAVPYPVVDAGNDTIICYGNPAYLRGSSNGSQWQWDPAATVSHPHALQTIANPLTSTTYQLTVTGNQGCPKPVNDWVNVRVLPKIIPFAGNDTAVVIGQPLQLQASGGVSYSWSPGDYLSDRNIVNPLANFDGSREYMTYRVTVFNEIGCFEADEINIRIFKTTPRLFVPNAFTPNSDGHNDRIRPIAAGIKQLNYFRIYNRWGQLVFSSSQPGEGWDGRVAGQLQEAGTYVWSLSAIDYLGQAYKAGGYFVLIR